MTCERVGTETVLRAREHSDRGAMGTGARHLIHSASNGRFMQLAGHRPSLEHKADLFSRGI